MMNKQPFLSKLLLKRMKNRVFMTALTADYLFYYSAFSLPMLMCSSLSVSPRAQQKKPANTYVY